MQLFQNTDNVLNPLERESFKLERDIQSLVERNMESLFGLEFVSTEFSIAEFRIDVLRGNIKENRSTKEGTVVTATGRSAEVAAGANTSHNCPTCAPTTSTSASTTSSATQTQVDKAGERITNSAINRFSYRIEQAINEGIDDLFYAR